MATFRFSLLFALFFLREHLFQSQSFAINRPAAASTKPNTQPVRIQAFGENTATRCHCFPSITRLSAPLAQVAGLCRVKPTRWAGEVELATLGRQNKSDLRLLLRRNDPIDCGHAVRLQEANTKWCKHLFIQIKKKKTKNKKKSYSSPNTSRQSLTLTHREKMKQKKPRRQTGLHFSCAYKLFFFFLRF